MQEEVQTLIDKANSIVQKTGHGPGVRYPKKLKDIVVSLALDYGLTINQIIKEIPISQYSAREWPKQARAKFKKITVKKEAPPPKKKTTSKRPTIELQFVILSLQVLLLSIQVFLEGFF